MGSEAAPVHERRGARLRDLHIARRRHGRGGVLRPALDFDQVGAFGRNWQRDQVRDHRVRNRDAVDSACLQVP